MLLFYRTIYVLTMSLLDTALFETHCATSTAIVAFTYLDDAMLIDIRHDQKNPPDFSEGSFIFYTPILLRRPQPFFANILQFKQRLHPC